MWLAAGCAIKSFLLEICYFSWAVVNLETQKSIMFSACRMEESEKTMADGHWNAGKLEGVLSCEKFSRARGDNRHLGEMEVNTREDFLRRNEQWCEWVLKKASHKGVGRLMEPGTSGKEPRMCGVEEAERELCGVSETVCEP